MQDYKVVILGASGSGKTLFLASMYEKLSVQREAGFFLEPSPEQRILLANKYKEVADISKGWPSGTGREVSEWDFNCVIKTKEGNYSLFRFTYLDYGGGIITDDPVEGDEMPVMIDEHAAEAVALLVLLDGQKIHYYMTNNELSSSLSLTHDLRLILPIIQKTQSKPVHFVLTKWDLLEDQYTLGEVRKKLMENEMFAAIIDQQKFQDSPTRLIPVSAVGKGFARLDEDGMVRKNPLGVPKPFQVEMPIACTLIDGFQIAKRKLTKRQLKILYHYDSLWDRFFRGLIMAGQITVDTLPPNYQLPQFILGRLIGYTGDRVDKSIDTIKHEQEDSQRAIEDEVSAMDSLLHSHFYLMRKLEQDFPESKLM